MPLCRWEEFTGVECDNEATKNLYNEARDLYVDVCEEHFNEFRRDMKERQP